MILSIEKIIKKKVNKFLTVSKKYKTKFSLPKIKSIVVNSNLGTELQNNDNFKEQSEEIFFNITLQKPKVLLAKKSVSNFKLRKKDKISLLCNLRKKRLNIFLTKLIFFVLPQIETTKLMKNHFDLNYNLNFGINEHLFFPEIGFSFNAKSFGLNINFVIKQYKDIKTKLYLMKILNLY